MSKRYVDEDLDLNDELEKKSKAKSRGKSRNSNSEEEQSIYIKEFDLNNISPSSVDSQNGTKIVVIGKPGCFKPGTEVIMWDGTIKKVEDVLVGDVLMGDDNTPRVVQELFHDYDEMYEIEPLKGDSYTVNKLHDLVLECTGYNQVKKGTRIIISVKDYLEKTKTWQISSNKIEHCMC